MPRKSKIEYVNTFNGKLGHCLNNQMKKNLQSLVLRPIIMESKLIT